MSSSHIPGPWSIGHCADSCTGERLVSIEGGDLGLAVGVFFCDCAPLPPDLALITAAPDLLAALLYLRDCIEDGIDPAMSAVNAAIAKAEGRAS